MLSLARPRLLLPFLLQTASCKHEWPVHTELLPLGPSSMISERVTLSKRSDDKELQKLKCSDQRTWKAEVAPLTDLGCDTEDSFPKCKIAVSMKRLQRRGRSSINSTIITCDAQCLDQEVPFLPLLWAWTYKRGHSPHSADGKCKQMKDTSGCVQKICTGGRPLHRSQQLTREAHKVDVCAPVHSEWTDDTNSIHTGHHKTT